MPRLSKIGAAALAAYGWTLGAAQYLLNKSLRFKQSANAYLSRTPSVAGNQQKWTFSVWLKRGNLSTSINYRIVSSGTISTTEGALTIYNDNLLLYKWNGSGFDFQVQSNAVFRDPAAWYHIVVSYDTTQATAANRVLMWVNGVQITSFNSPTYPSLNYSGLLINSNVIQDIGFTNGASTSYQFDGYMAEIRMIDGQYLTPSSFGAFNSYAVWSPIAYSGTYGTNGYYLPFTNTTNTTTLGYDFSGNNNNWTCNNISLTAGYTYDSMTDVPTLTSATASNYAVMNYLITSPTNASFSNGNLTYTSLATSANWSSTIALPISGKWYFEAVFTSGPFLGGTGVGQTPSSTAFTASNYFLNENGALYVNGSISTNLGSTWTTGDVIGTVADMDNNKLYWYKNGTLINAGGYSINAPTTSNPYFFFGNIYTSSISVNFGQQGFTYTPPLSSLALNTFNM